MRTSNIWKMFLLYISLRLKHDFFTIFWEKISIKVTVTDFVRYKRSKCEKKRIAHCAQSYVNLNETLLVYQ